MAQYAKRRDPSSPPPRRRRRKSRAGAVVTVLLAILLLVGLGAFYLHSEVQGTLRPDQPVEVTIPQGSSVSQIAGQLKEAGVIGNTYLFRYYARPWGGSFQYGDFTLVPGEGYDGIIRTLQEMRHYRETVSVTFPEGYNAYQIGDVLESAGLCTREDFLDAVNTHTYDVGFWDQIGTDPRKLVRLEGYLFPDTYQFFSDATVDDIVLTLLRTFEQKVLTPERKEAIAASGYTLEELVIFASVIQRESANVEEMYNVSSVFYNRMQPGSPHPQLESDTTNFYIRDYIQPAYGGNAPAEVLQGYDTYGMSGLPAGAIAASGLDAIDAALHPNDTPYYFFVTDLEYNHYYGRTFDEHQQNIQKALAVNRTLGVDGLYK